MVFHTCLSPSSFSAGFPVAPADSSFDNPFDDPFEATRKRIERLKAEGELPDLPREPTSQEISGTLVDPPNALTAGELEEEKHEGAHPSREYP